MKVGLFGLPGSGVTTLFCIFTEREYQSVTANGKTEIHLGETRVPDERVDRLADIFQPKKKTYADIQFADVPVSVEPGGALSAATVNQLRPMDALALVVRAFDNPAVPFSRDTVDPLRDLKSACEEAVLTDLIQVEKRLDRIVKEGRKTDPEGVLFQMLKEQLESFQPLRDLHLSGDQEKMISGFRFLTRKPWLIILNIDAGKAIDIREIAAFLDRENFPWIRISGEMELEIADLADSDREEFYRDLGFKYSARERFIRGCYQYLDLISFLTVGSDECRAWSLRAGSDAVDASGKIHQDLARGFIRAEVISFSDFIQAGTMAGAKKIGKLRLEGKQYVVQDGDIMNIRFNA